MDLSTLPKPPTPVLHLNDMSDDSEYDHVPQFIADSPVLSPTKSEPKVTTTKEEPKEPHPLIKDFLHPIMRRYGVEYIIMTIIVGFGFWRLRPDKVMSIRKNGERQLNIIKYVISTLIWGVFMTVAFELGVWGYKEFIHVDE